MREYSKLNFQVKLEKIIKAFCFRSGGEFTCCLKFFLNLVQNLNKMPCLHCEEVIDAFLLKQQHIEFIFKSGQSDPVCLHFLPYYSVDIERK